MPIPDFTIDGVLPPFVGANGPGGAVEDMSPYAASALEVVSTFGHTDRRKTILKGWLRYREALRSVGFNRGFQWLDGSFVEQKDPKDLDIVTFPYRPIGTEKVEDFHKLLKAHQQLLFDRTWIKQTFNLDAFFVDLNGSPEATVKATRYWVGLFSHRRGDNLWKGILQARLDSVDDDIAALRALGDESTAVGVVEGVNL